MGQNLQDGKKVLWVSLMKPHSETHPVQTIHPTDLGLIPTWKSIVWAPAQGFPTSWDARKRVQERFAISCRFCPIYIFMFKIHDDVAIPYNFERWWVRIACNCVHCFNFSVKTLYVKCKTNGRKSHRPLTYSRHGLWDLSSGSNWPLGGSSYWTNQNQILSLIPDTG